MVRSQKENHLHPQIFFSVCLNVSRLLFSANFIFSAFNASYDIEISVLVTLISLRKIFVASRLSSQALVKDICLLFFSSQFGKNVRKCNLSHESTLLINVSSSHFPRVFV